MFGSLNALFLNPYPARAVLRRLIEKTRLGSYEQRVRIGAVARPHYGYCVYNAAVLARKLGYPRISVVEYGVARGDGLVNLEYHAREVSRALKIGIDVYGFDTGEGLPSPVDYRDLPYHWQRTLFQMDVPRLQARLKGARLVLGNIEETGRSFFEKYQPAPVGAISYDVDYYSSTKAAFAMLDAGEKFFLPRVFCYFDDTLGGDIELISEHTGERLAIREFNETHPHVKFGLPYHLQGRSALGLWVNQIWVCHFFGHSRYNDFIG